MEELNTCRQLGATVMDKPSPSSATTMSHNHLLGEFTHMMKKKMLATAVAAAMATTMIISSNVIADRKDEGSKSGPFGFTPIKESANSADWDATVPWKLPEGFTQTIVSDETDLNVFDGRRNDWPDMNTVNESGKMMGRFMYRTHELRGQAEGGAVSVIDLKTGETTILTQDPSYQALDGVRCTPWGTVLFAEVSAGGRLLETTLNEHMVSAASVDARHAIRLWPHEGIDIAAESNVYVVSNQRAYSAD